MRLSTFPTLLASYVAVSGCRGESRMPAAGACEELEQVLCGRAPTQCEAIGRALSAMQPAEVPACSSTLSSLDAVDAVAREQRPTAWAAIVQRAQAASPAIAGAVEIVASDDVRSATRVGVGDDALPESPGMFGYRPDTDLVVWIDPSRILLASLPAASHEIPARASALLADLRRHVEDQRRRSNAAGEEFEATVTLHVAGDTPYAAVWSLIDAASKAGLREFRLATRQGADLREIVAAPEEDSNAEDAIVLRIDADGVAIEPDGRALDDTTLGRELGARKQADPKRRRSVVRPGGTTPWRDVVRVLDRARGPACEERALLESASGPQCWFWQHELGAPH